MERRKKEISINSTSKIHIIYVTIIALIGISSGITIFTMKHSYEDILKQNGLSLNKDDVHANVDMNNASASGGMPPFLKKILEETKAALEKDPNDLKALTDLANMYYDSGQYSKAIEFYERATKVAPNDINILTDLGTSYFNTEQNEKAIEMYKKAIEKDPKHINAKFNLGYVYKTINKKDLAKKYWEDMYKMLTDVEQKKKLRSMIDELDKT